MCLLIVFRYVYVHFFHFWWWYISPEHLQQLLDINSWPSTAGCHVSPTQGCRFFFSSRFSHSGVFFFSTTCLPTCLSACLPQIELKLPSTGFSCLVARGKVNPAFPPSTRPLGSNLRHWRQAEHTVLHTVPHTLPVRIFEPWKCIYAFVGGRAANASYVHGRKVGVEFTYSSLKIIAFSR